MSDVLIFDNSPGYNVLQINVIVPRTLRVSEGNRFKPNADIVWHGEAYGDRIDQVSKIVRDAMALGTAGFKSGRGVALDVQVLRFHALTPKTRATIGGEHELVYLLRLRDAATGEVIIANQKVNATVRGAGGEQAFAEEAVGRTQLVVIQEALAASIQRALSQGRVSPKRGAPELSAGTAPSFARAFAN